MNARIPIGTMPAMAGVSVIERCYPHIAEGLVAAWHDPDATDLYLNSILVDERIGRQGLPEEIFAELMFVSDLNLERRQLIGSGLEFVPDEFSFGDY